MALKTTPGARARYGGLFPSAFAKPGVPADAKARPGRAQSTATRPASNKAKADRPTDFGHLVKASRARGVEQLEPVTPSPKVRTLGERHRALLRARGETVPEPVDALPEQPRQRRNTTSTLGERVAAVHKKIGR